MGAVGRFLTTLIIVLAILLTTVFFAVRTAGGRSFLQDALAKRLGRNVALGSARIGFPYDLVLGAVVSSDYDAGRSGFRCEEARVGIGPGRVRLTLAGPEINLRRNADGVWAPELFGKIGGLPWRKVGEISTLTEDLRKSTALHVRGGGINWLDEQGRVLASAADIAFDLSPVRLPGRRVYHYRLSVYSVLDVEGRRVNALQREWLASADKAYLELSRSDPEGRLPAKGFWENGE
jgi:hypothetical protein